MDLKILDKDNKEQSITVVSETMINSSAILNVDIALNNTTTIETVNKALAIVEDNNYLTNLKNKVVKMSKRNTLIIKEYDMIKETVFKNINKDMEKTNELINTELMKLQILGKTKKVFNCYDFWYTHNDKKLEYMTTNYNTLKTYQKVFNETKRD